MVKSIVVIMLLTSLSLHTVQNYNIILVVRPFRELAIVLTF